MKSNTMRRIFCEIPRLFPIHEFIYLIGKLHDLADSFAKFALIIQMRNLWGCFFYV